MIRSIRQALHISAFFFCLLRFDCHTWNLHSHGFDGAGSRPVLCFHVNSTHGLIKSIQYRQQQKHRLCMYYSFDALFHSWDARRLVTSTKNIKKNMIAMICVGRRKFHPMANIVIFNQQQLIAAINRTRNNRTTFSIFFLPNRNNRMLMWALIVLSHVIVCWLVLCWSIDPHCERHFSMQCLCYVEGERNDGSSKPGRTSFCRTRNDIRKPKRHRKYQYKYSEADVDDTPTALTSMLCLW